MLRNVGERRFKAFGPGILGLLPALLAIVLVLPASAQVIEFESGGLKYQTLTRNGVTIMYAHLPILVRGYAALQVAVSNGGKQPLLIRPEDFVWNQEEATQLRPTPARQVVSELLQKGGRNDVIDLVAAYESGLYGVAQLRSSSGYEARRRSALGEVSSTRLKAAAAASAIVFVQMKLAAGESTDGALFFSTAGKPMPAGVLRVVAGGVLFEFEPYDPAPPKQTLARPNP